MVMEAWEVVLTEAMVETLTVTWEVVLTEAMVETLMEVIMYINPLFL